MIRLWWRFVSFFSTLFLSSRYNTAITQGFTIHSTNHHNHHHYYYHSTRTSPRTSPGQLLSSTTSNNNNGHGDDNDNAVVVEASRGAMNITSMVDAIQKTPKSKRIKLPAPASEIGPAWVLQYRALEDYKYTFGDCMVPKPFPGLGNWVSKQRQEYRKWMASSNDDTSTAASGTSMCEERAQALQDLGFHWVGDTRNHASHQDILWYQRYDAYVEALEAFKKAHNGATATTTEKATKSKSNTKVILVDDHLDPPLRGWANRQRTYYHNNNKSESDKKTLSLSLQQDRIDALEKVGFDFSPPLDQRWNVRFEQLRRCYANEQNDKSIADAGLKAWMRTQRTNYQSYNDDKKSTNLTAEKIDKLNSIGFDWKS